MSASIKFAELFSDVRNILGFTQAQMARSLGVSQPLISKIEAGTNKPDGLVLVRLYDLAQTRLKGRTRFKKFFRDHR